jgi:hypothetical protein
MREAASAKEVKATLAAAFGACEICGKTLSVPSSVQAGIGPICACKPTGPATGAEAAPIADHDDSPAPDTLADRPVLSLGAQVDKVYTALTILRLRLAREELPIALDPYAESSVRLAKACQEVVHTLTEHPVVLEAVYPPRAAPATAKAPPAPKAQQRPQPAKKRAQAGQAQPSGLLSGAVLAMAERQRRFTCKALAEALHEEVKAVWQVLQRLLKQGVVRREGDDYVYLGRRASDGS